MFPFSLQLSMAQPREMLFFWWPRVMFAHQQWTLGSSCAELGPVPAHNPVWVPLERFSNSPPQAILFILAKPLHW